MQDSSFLGKKCILLAQCHVPCFLFCSVSKMDLLSFIASPQLARCCSCWPGVSPDRAVDFHSMQTSTLMCSVKWLQEFAACDSGCCHSPVTLLKIPCMQTWCVCVCVPLYSSWAKSSRHPCMHKEPECSREPVSDFALKWIKIMHKIQSASMQDW